MNDYCTRATIELLCQEMPESIAPNLWSPNSTDLSPVDCKIWAVMQHCVYQRQIHSEMTYIVSSGTLNPTIPFHSVDELRWQLVDV